MGPGFTSGASHPPLLAKTSGDCRVTKFIDPVSREWNLDMISDLVPETVRGVISQIHVEPFLIPDKLVWPFERHGSYLLNQAIGGVTTIYPNRTMIARPLPEILIPGCELGFGVAKPHQK